VIEVKNYIDGKWVAGSGASFESFNPRRARRCPGHR
jgi:hypothetical protein